MNPSDDKTLAAEPLYSPAVVKHLLKKHGLRADKAFGQNFLIDGNILRGIADATEINKGDTILEIGPGLGVLTKELAHRATKVISVELDARLLPVLNETLANFSNVEIIHGDGLHYDLSTLPEQSLLIANLPYNIATPLLIRALESQKFKRLVFLVQKEVAQRLIAEPSDAQYGALSLLVRYFSKASILKDVRPSAFLPPPEVTSSVVRIDTFTGVSADPELFKLIHIAFRHRRKTLKKNLIMAGYQASTIEKALGELELDPRARAETLGLKQFRELANLLKS